MTEEWLPVIGYEGFYEVSNQGRIKTLEHSANYKNIKTRTIPSKIRSTNARLKGYPAVNLCREGMTKMRAVHIMVLESFVGPRPSREHDGCHSDGNPVNNILSNLRWGTKVENMRDRADHGTAATGERSGMAKLTTEMVRKIRTDPRMTQLIAQDLGVHRSTITKIKSGRSWAHVE